MRAGFIEEPGKAYFKEVPEPQIEKSTDVKIKVVVTGICGSEVHAYHGKHAWRVPPLVSGHEFAGIVVEVGSDVTSVKVGDRVKAGQTVCILEAMKLMNEIESDFDCEIEAVLASNEQKIKYGQPLFKVKKLDD